MNGQSDSNTPRDGGRDANAAERIANGISAANRKCLDALREIGRAHAKRFHGVMKTYPDVERILLLNGTAAALLNHPRDADYAIRADGLNRYKKEILRDRDKYAAIAWMRGEFGKELVELGQQLQIPIAEHGSDLCWIALMNGQSIDWLNREFENARPKFREEFRSWIAIASDGVAPRQDWRAPLWLARFPEPLDFRGSVAAALPYRLKLPGTKAVLDAAASRLDFELERAEQMALDRAHIEFATQIPTEDARTETQESQAAIDPGVTRAELVTFLRLGSLRNEQAARALNCDERTIKRRKQNGRLNGTKDGKVVVDQKFHEALIATHGRSMFEDVHREARNHPSR
jgi:hypothetical protein